MQQNLHFSFYLPRSKALSQAINRVATSNLKERGAFFTKKKVAYAILDLCGYSSDKPLYLWRFLEPSFGNGDFLFPAVERLIAAFKRDKGSLAKAELLFNAIRAIELHSETFEKTSAELVKRLITYGVAISTAYKLVKQWLLNDDFLLTEIDGYFDIIAGNPPYIRQEHIPNLLQKVYKQKFNTYYGRADLYVLFYERGLDLLKNKGILGYICANRWIKNKYGTLLRSKIAKNFRLKFFINLEEINVFHMKVLAYPAITVIQKGIKGHTYIALNVCNVTNDLARIAEDMLLSEKGKIISNIKIINNVAVNSDPWLLNDPHILNLIRRLEVMYPTIEDAEVQIGIGVATGADKIFIRKYEELPVEKNRKLKLVVTSDCTQNEIIWGGKGIINPYLASGQLASFKAFPLFAFYMKKHQKALKKRYIARKQPNKWYKTIDKINLQLLTTPKLLIPDIKNKMMVLYDAGEYYPHHNLYVVTSERWNLKALQTILRSSIALMFVMIYSVRMKGGFFRFQAQYLRRIRLPKLMDLSSQQILSLIRVAKTNNQQEIDSVVLPLFKISKTEAKELFTFIKSTQKNSLRNKGEK